VNLNDGQFWDRMTKEIINFQANLSSSNSEYLAPGPCPNGSIIVDVTKKACWKWINDPIGTSVTLLGCEDQEGYCYQHFSVCWDYSAQVPELVITKLYEPPVGQGCNSSPAYDPGTMESDCWVNCSN